MYITISTNEMVNKLMTDEYANWTYEEATALTAYYEELEEETDEPMQFDRVAIRCDWSSATLDEVISSYSTGEEDLHTCEEKLEWLQDRTQVIELDDSLLYIEF